MGRKRQFYKIPISQFFREKIKKRCQKGGQKLTFWTPLRTRGVRGSIVSAIFDVLVRCQKTMFFRSAPKRPKIIKNRSKMRPRAAPRPQTSRKGAHFEVEGPRGGGQLSKKSIKSIKNNVGVDYLPRRWAQGPANLPC